ncbi:MAG TPA: GAF and ANTAR domain-containing protein [Dermatophilaceae bacterium]|nr:GAF and ANTAR domain-containing protein [Dermatophilaceae bacterium]
MDDSGRYARIVRLIDELGGAASAPGVVGRLIQLCTTVVRSLPAAGAGVVLMSPGVPGGVVAASDPTSNRLLELQITLGEGPCLDAYESRRPVLEPDLPGAGQRRWPAYATALSEHGMRAVFAIPLQIGGARLGVMDIYRAESGPLPVQTLSDAFGFGEVAVGTLLDGQAAVPEGGIDADLADALAYRTEVYQAQGMVMVHLGVDLAEAIVRLRAHAFAQNRPLSEVSADVLAGRLRLERDDA